MEATRIAPTPSGFLHAGNAINFLLTWMIARERHARLRLRIDDLDMARSRPAFVADIFEGLAWLDIAWDDGPRTAVEYSALGTQVDRIPRYAFLLDRLVKTGVVYACTCSRATLTGRKGPHTCRDARLPLDAPDSAWRLRLAAQVPVRIAALYGSDVDVDLATMMEDPVLRQRDGRPSYQIASLADDLDHSTTFLVRGEDLLPSSACQLHIAGLLGEAAFTRVRMAHHPVLRDANGNKLSKSAGADSLKAMRARGEGPDALRRQAAELWREIAGSG